MKHKSLFYTLIFASAAFLILFTASPARAYFRGGEITWSCTPQGNFSFTMKLYRDCAGPGTFGDTLWIKSNFPGFDSIGMVRAAIHDITPECDCPAGAALSCATATQTGSGALEEHIYTSDAYFPNGVPLTGVPPVTGYYFAFEGCCRAPTANLASGNSNFAIRSVMYPYWGSSINPCFDQTPIFNERSPIITCSGSSNWYIHKMFDPELDSIACEWARPLHDINTPVTAYNAGYSFNSPLPHMFHDSTNIPATLNPKNGDLAFRSTTTGSFTIVAKITAYRCGLKVAEIFREMPVIVVPCPPNNSPELFVNGILSPWSTTDTVTAGTLVNYLITVTDTDTCQGSVPVGLQTVKLSTFGIQYGAPMMPPIPNAGTWLCLNPPCATLSPVIHYDSTLSGSSPVHTSLIWQTGLQHIATQAGCGTTTNAYDFYFTVTDNFCPVPAKRNYIHRIIVWQEVLSSTPIVCADVQPNGDVLVSWHEAIDTTNTFIGYHLKASGQQGGPFVGVDSLYFVGQNSTTHHGAGADLHPVYYLLQISSQGSPGWHPVASFDTISTLFVEVTGYDTATGITHLGWNPLRTNPLSGTPPEYTIHREYPAGTWSVAGTTTALTSSDTLPPGNKLVRYRVSTSDTVFTSGGPVVCQSNSNIAELLITVGINQHDPEGFILGQNIPNPAGRSTTIPFHLPGPGRITMVVHDIRGSVMTQQVMEGQAGENTFTLDLSGYAAGIYSYTIHYQDSHQRRTMIVE
jgi:hypothetical protein